MEKKIFINPSASVMKLESSSIICGSGSSSINTPISNGSGIGGSTPGSTPTPTSDAQGNTGIFGEARNGALGFSLDVMDF